MKRYFFKKKKIKSASGSSHWTMAAFIFFLIVTLCLVGLYGYQDKMVLAYVKQIRSWVDNRKNHIHESINKVKQIATNKRDQDQDVHFEFYTALPNMQVQSATPVTNMASTIPVSAKLAAKTSPVTSPVIKSIVSADQLERELANELKKG